MVDDAALGQFWTAIRGGDVPDLTRLVAAHPDLTTDRFPVRNGTKTCLHFVTDWPGHFPRGPEIVRLLLAAGADVDAATTPGPPETPLHWAASSDDAAVAAALIDGGATLDTPGGSIGSPLDNAVGYGCWHVAHLLAARGAPVDKPWLAAALGHGDRLTELLTATTDPATDPGADIDAVSQAFWHACAAGQRRTAELCLDAGANPNWQPPYAQGTALDAARGHGTQRSLLIDWLTTRSTD